MIRFILSVVLTVPLVCGCSGIYSEVQKSQIRAAGCNVMVNGVELRLDSKLERRPKSDGKGFDLVGRLVVSSQSGEFPRGVNVYHFALKPGWKGWPGYYVMNFSERHGNWRLVTARDGGESFSGVSKTEGNKVVVEFTWRDQGRGLGKKPEHFATYDVSVSVSDANQKRHILTQLGVRTD